MGLGLYSNAVYTIALKKFLLKEKKIWGAGRNPPKQCSRNSSWNFSANWAGGSMWGRKDTPWLGSCNAGYLDDSITVCGATRAIPTDAQGDSRETLGSHWSRFGAGYQNKVGCRQTRHWFSAPQVINSLCLLYPRKSVVKSQFFFVFLYNYFPTDFFSDPSNSEACYSITVFAFSPFSLYC